MIAPWPFSHGRSLGNPVVIRQIWDLSQKFLKSPDIDAIISYDQIGTIMSKILLATNNRGKLIEIQALLAQTGAELVMPGQVNLNLEVIEDGQTYAQNARSKAIAFALASHLPSIADDSGLEVDVLGGKPGLYSARFSPLPGATDADRRSYLLEQLQAFPRPWLARFRCVVALITPQQAQEDQTGQIVEGICPGEIIPEERGSHGFGYDPIFLLPEFGRTMAELSMEEKNRVSHRARAVRAAIPYIIEMLKLNS
jgi:XTP/dITP diphosphohydrolase